MELGIVGLGRGFMLTLPALRAHARVNLRGAFDLREEAVQRFASEFSAKAYSSLESMLSDPVVDAVYIATPHELHAQQAIAALHAGKHVLVEKPMAISLDDCLAMAQAAKATRKHLVVGPSHGFDKPVTVAADLVASGRYGLPKLVTAFNFTDFMYRPRRPEELQEEHGGGVIYSQAAHQIDVVRRIVGADIQWLRSVTGNWDEKRPSNGAYAALAGFENGAAATLTYSGYAHYDSDELVGWVSELGYEKDPSEYGKARREFAPLSRDEEIEAKLARTYGLNSGYEHPSAPHHEHFGFILASCEKADLKVLPNGIEIYSDTDREFRQIEPPLFARAAVVDEFAAAISGEAQPVHDAAWGLQTMACCVAIAQSGQTGHEIAPAALIRHLKDKVSR